MQPHPWAPARSARSSGPVASTAGWWAGRAATNRSAKSEVAVVPRTGAVWRTIAQSSERSSSPAAASWVSTSWVRISRRPAQPVELLQHERQGPGEGRGDGAQAQSSAAPGRGVPGGDLRLLGMPDQRAAVVQEHGSGGADGDRPLGAVQQFTAELLFELLDRLGQRRLGHLQPLRRTAEVEFFGDRDEIPGLTDLDHDSRSLLPERALDQLGLPSGVGGIRPVWGPAAVVGFAVTVGLEPRAEGPAGAHIATTAVESSDDRSVIVVDNQGRTDVSCWGGILSLGAARRGVRDVVADGVCREVTEARELGFPVFSRGSIPATARAGCSSTPLASRSASPGSRSSRATSSSPTRPVSSASRWPEPRKWRSSRPRSSPRERAIADEVRAGAPLSQAMHDARLAGDKESVR